MTVRDAPMRHWLALGLGVLVVDQVSKTWVDHAFALYESRPLTGFFNLTYVQNTGAAFSMLGDAGGWQQGVFIALALAASAFLGRWLWTLGAGQRLQAAGVSLVLGGAVGNLVDRVLYGHVIDFFDFHLGGWHFAAFNVADAAITAGVGLLLLDMLKGGRDTG